MDDQLRAGDHPEQGARLLPPVQRWRGVVAGRKHDIETTVQVAVSTYYAAKKRPASARAIRDGELRPRLRALWQDNYRVYGARKLWKAARRAGLEVGRDQVARLMRAEGIEGARRTKRVRTTKAAEGAARHPDLVGRDFTATGANQLCVTDLTYVPTWAGVAYVCFIIDAYSRMIVGWRSRRTCAPRWSSTRSRWPANPAAPS